MIFAVIFDAMEPVISDGGELSVNGRDFYRFGLFTYHFWLSTWHFQLALFFR